VIQSITHGQDSDDIDASGCYFALIVCYCSLLFCLLLV
jgi:hypothetical protein